MKFPQPQSYYLTWEFEGWLLINDDHSYKYTASLKAHLIFETSFRKEPQISKLVPRQGRQF